MADISGFYREIAGQMLSGVVSLEETGEYGMPLLMRRLSLGRIVLRSPVLSALEAGGFTLKGRFSENGRNYDALLTVDVSGERDAPGRESDFVCLLQARLVQDGDVLLSSVYPAAPMYSAVNFYARGIDLFDGVWLRKAVIAADTRPQTQTPQFSLWLVFGEECPVYENFGRFAPQAGECLHFRGEADEPLAAPHYVIAAPFLKRISLPFYGTWKEARRCEFVINSHASWADSEEGEAGYQCRAGARFLVTLPQMDEDGVWFSVDFATYGSMYYLYVDFGGGKKVQDAVGLVAQLSGHGGLPDLPDWARLEGLALLGIVLGIDTGSLAAEKTEEPEAERLSGCAFSFALELPSLPIPFFDKAQGGARAQLIVQWNLLELGGSLSVIAGFYALWKGHRMKINVELPALRFQGIYDAARGEARGVNGIFPAFVDLSVRYIRLSGDLRENAYQLAFELENSNARTIPIGAHQFQIDYIAAQAAYSPKGFELSVSLEFTLFTAIIELEGSYQKEGEEQFLTLRGGLVRPFCVSALVALITGETVSEGGLDFQIDRLELVYRTLVSGGDASSDAALGRPVYFEFLCGIAFEWGDGNRIASSFHLQWEEGTYRLWVSAAITLFECFVFSASCKVSIKSGELELDNFRFAAKIRSVEITAVYDADKNLTFRVVNFNLGELIEGLVSLVAPNHDWYLPWPFTVLKRITLKELDVVIDREKRTIRADYKIDLKILFLTVESVGLFYDDVEGDFFVNVKTGASAGEKPQGVGSRGAAEAAEGTGDTYALNILKEGFPSVKGLGDRMFSLKYLGIGQHIAVEVPRTFTEDAFPGVLENIKKSIGKAGRPRLSGETNWVCALQVKLIDAIDLTLLMCDPSFYGLQVEIGGGSELVAQLEGLSFTILYSKVTDSVGMFYARLKFPEAFRVIELGAVQLCPGEIAVWIYTDGNFRIDMGFPHNGDFSNSFALTYLLFTGRGGFYFGLLNGDTSQALPDVPRGHFETVVELGIGISAGVGRQIGKGSLKAGAYVMLTAIFEGVLANYKPAQEGARDSVYYKVKACAAVTVSVYGSVDFVLIQVGFSVNASFMVELTLESYESAQLPVRLSFSVEAYVKILFLSISFCFDFSWEDNFTLGERGTPPWSADILEQRGGIMGRAYRMHWFGGALWEEKKEIQVEVVPYFTFDGAQIGKAGSGQRKVAFLPLLHGLTRKTCETIGYGNQKETPFAVLVEGCLMRAVRSVTDADVSGELLAFLQGYLDEEESFEEGFGFQELDTFLSLNVVFSYTKSEDAEDVEIDGIPFVLYPRMELIWFQSPDGMGHYDLEAEPLVGADFLKQMQDYYGRLSVWTDAAGEAGRRGDGAQGKRYSASAFLFMQYFYMLTKIVVSIALEQIGEETLTLEQTVELVTSPENLAQAAGMVSRFCYGGNRSYSRQEGTRSLYAFALQEFDGLDPAGFSEADIIHKMTMRLKSAGTYREGMAADFGRLGGRGVRLHRRSFQAQRMRMRGADFDGADQDALEWVFRKGDLVYPQDMLRMEFPVEQEPFYRRQQKTVELKNPLGLLGGGNVCFWEMQAEFSGDCKAVLYPGTESAAEVAFTKGFLLQIPVRESAGNIFTVEPLSYDNRNWIAQALRDEITEIEAYRRTNELDSDNCGLAALDGPVFLGRSNLSLESERPEVSRGRVRESDSTTESVYGNSAYLTEHMPFLSLLKEGASVNGRGYYLKFSLAERHILDEGRMTLVLWVGTRKHSAAVRMADGRVTPQSHPVIVTGEEQSVYAYEPGMFAFRMKADEACRQEGARGMLRQQYQMLNFRIVGNEYFKESPESRPLIAQGTEGESLYGQVVPALRFAREGDGPYAGIRRGSRLKMEFRLVDFLGNRAGDGKEWEMQYGYTDPLLPVAAYPHTKCAYVLERTGQAYRLCVVFQYAQEEAQRAFRLAQGTGEGKTDRNLELAYWQLKCPDISAALTVCGKETVVDVRPLFQYIRTLYEGGIPEEVTYTVPFEAGETPTPIEVAFVVNRNPGLLAGSLRGSEEAAQVLSATSVIREDGERSERGYLARRGKDGQLFFVPSVSPRFGGCVLWTLPPLSNRLYSLEGIKVRDAQGQERTISCYRVDMEEWADGFLQDMEGFLLPDSIYGDDRDTYEALLEIKKGLASVIASGVAPLENSVGGGGEAAVLAASYYENLMLHNLHNGRDMDGVLLLSCGSGPAAGSAWCFRAKAGVDDLTLKPGKCRAEGILPIGIKTGDVSRRMGVDCTMELVHTDWEMADGDDHDYLTIQEQTCLRVPVQVSLPYKRYPAVPVLKAQGYKGWGDAKTCLDLEDYRRWNYEMTFEQEAAEQDILTIRLFLSECGRAMGEREDFFRALAQYWYLRDEFLKSAELKESLLDVCRDIRDSWTYRSAASGLTAEKEAVIRFSISYDKKRLSVSECGFALEQLRIYMGDEAGEEVELRRAEGAVYLLPDDLARPGRFRVVVGGLDIREVNRINACLSVVRNQNIAGIREEFVYRTDEVRFKDELTPFLQYHGMIRGGRFERSRFTERMEEICEGFGRVVLEAYCKAPVSSYGKEGGGTETVCCYLPILLVPDAAPARRTQLFGTVYDAVAAWVEEGFAGREETRKQLLLQIHLTLFDISDAARKLVELTNVVFDFQ